MQAFHTAGLPPKSGKTILPTMGWIMNNNEALTKSVAANNRGTGALQGSIHKLFRYNEV
jgi:hypothetical protein